MTVFWWGSLDPAGWSTLNCPCCMLLCSRCLAHSEPHDLGESGRAILRNMAELIVRELWGCYEHEHQQRILQLVSAQCT